MAGLVNFDEPEFGSSEGLINFDEPDLSSYGKMIHGSSKLRSLFDEPCTLAVAAGGSLFLKKDLYLKMFPTRMEPERSQRSLRVELGPL